MLIIKNTLYNIHHEIKQIIIIDIVYLGINEYFIFNSNAKSFTVRQINYFNILHFPEETDVFN